MLRRIRGEILLKRDPANPAPAEKAFRAAIAIARRQGSRSFGLQAALALAELYQSTGRPLDAHAVLAPALEGFAPTPELPTIAEAQAPLATLAESEGVRSDAARRQRLTQLHVAYGNALLAARGPGASETTEAFARARESAYGKKDALERLAAGFGLWAGSRLRGDLPSMKAHAGAFLSDIEARPDSPEAGVARRAAGVTCWAMHSAARGGRFRRTVVRDRLDSSNPDADASHPATQSLLRRDAQPRDAERLLQGGRFRDKHSKVCFDADRR
jgi:hypothetical protein